MKVFITGGSGFVGLNLSQLLLSRGDHVTLFSATPSFPGALSELTNLGGALEVLTGDVTDAPSLTQALGRSGAEVFVHMAAITAGRRREADEPERIFDVNVRGTLVALRAARSASVRRFVLASTGAVFGSESFPPELVTEDLHLPAPVSLYDISKFAAERAILHLGDLWEMDVVAGRLPMVFGAWEFRTGLRDHMSALWELSRLARTGGQAVVPDAGVQDWMYGPDAALALAALIDEPQLPHRLYHLGIEEPWGLREWAERLAERYPKFQYRLSNRNEDVTVAARGTLGRTPFNTTRLRTDLGFRARFPLNAAFSHYMDWLDLHPNIWGSEEVLA